MKFAEGRCLTSNTSFILVVIQIAMRIRSRNFYLCANSHSSSERSERFVRFEPNVRSERVRYFSERETNVQALKRLINLISVK